MLRVLWCRAGMEMEPGLESVMTDGKVDGDVLLRDLRAEACGLPGVERYHPLTGLGDPVSGSGSIVQPPSQITISKTTHQNILLKHKGYLRFRKSILILHRQPPLIPRSQKRHQREIHHHRQSP